MRHPEDGVHEGLHEHLAQDRRLRQLHLAREQVHTRRHPGAPPDRELGHRCAVGRPRLDLRGEVGAREIGLGVAHQQLDAHTVRGRGIELRGEPPQQRRRVPVRSPKTRHIVHRELYALAHRRDPDERHRAAGGDKRHGQHHRSGAAGERERADRSHPEQRVQGGQTGRRLEHQRRGDNGDRRQHRRDPRGQPSLRAERRLPRRHTEEQDGDRREKERDLPGEPEPRGHADDRHLDAAREFAQQEGTDAGDEQHADERLDARARPHARTQRREQSEQQQPARDRQRAGVRGEPPAGPHVEDGGIEERGVVREGAEWHEQQHAEGDAERAQSRGEPLVALPGRDEQQHQQQREGDRRARQSALARFTEQRLRRGDQWPCGEHRFAPQSQQHGVRRVGHGRGRRVGESAETVLLGHPAVERPAQAVGGGVRMEEHGRDRYAIAVVRDAVGHDIERRGDHAQRSGEGIHRNEQASSPGEGSATLGQDHRAVRGLVEERGHLLEGRGAFGRDGDGSSCHAREHVAQGRELGGERGATRADALGDHRVAGACQAHLLEMLRPRDPAKDRRECHEAGAELPRSMPRAPGEDHHGESEHPERRRETGRRAPQPERPHEDHAGCRRGPQVTRRREGALASQRRRVSHAVIIPA